MASRRRTATLFTCAAVAAAVVPNAAWAQGFRDDFSSCQVGSPPDGSKWMVPETQWGGDNVNGGVSPKNVACQFDSTLKKNVLALTAHGDQFTGTGPTGVLKNGEPRPNYEEFTGWSWGAYKAPCTPHCDVKRVGGAITSKQAFDGGHLQVHMKPCKEFGVASATWLFNYTEHYCDTSSSSCSPAYQAQCCGGVACTPTNDVCKGAWFANLEIDIEQPTSDSGSQYRAIDPQWINFHNMRFSSYTALISQHGAKCGTMHPCSKQDYAFVGKLQNDGNYHTYDMWWDTKNYNVTFAVDGTTMSTITGPNLVPSLGKLWLSAWIPDSWAGSPAFDTCQMLVDYVQLEPM